jgi:hypothetical protein
MPGWKRFLRILPVVLLVPLAAGCNVLNRSSEANFGCPSGEVPREASKVTRFRDGPGRDLTDIVVEGEIYDILIQCKREKQTVAVDLQIGFSATRGPADRSRRADFDYWVAIVDGQRNVLSREAGRVRFDFKDNRMKLSYVSDEMEPLIPFKDPKEPSGYFIVVGFQLTPEEMAWNRSQAAKQ